MMNKSVFAVIMFLFFNSLSLVAQDSTNSDKKFQDKEDEEKLDEMVFGEWKFDKHSNPLAIQVWVPTIELNYGMTQPSYHKDVFSGDFADAYSVGLAIGYSHYLKFKPNINLVDYECQHLLLSNSYSESSASPDIRTNTWRFGIANSEGLGYILGQYSSIILYHSTGWSWSKIEFKDIALTEVSQKALDKFEEVFRFGDHFEAGMKIRIDKLFTLNAGYERIMVFPRHLFWYWSLSEIIEDVGTGAADSFVKYVAKSSTIMTPIINFVLKNGISYLMFELRKKNMNWPIETTAPMLFDSYKVGITFTL